VQCLEQSTHERLLAAHLVKNGLAQVIRRTVIRCTVTDKGGD
jgi:hypothetical protein